MSEKHDYDLGTLYHGDCLEVLRELPADSLDSVVSDPPAGIAFMGKEWDRFEEAEENPSGPQTDTWSNRGDVPFDRIPTPRFQGKTKASLQPFQDFLAGVAEELLRVLKPGGHALVWSIPRTSHHTGMALERAGFEVRDCISHIFGCLSEDTEILTERGWEPYHTLVEGRLALCYDAGHGTFQWQAIQQVYLYPYCDTAYRLLGDHTDQVVSRNHRCLVERSGSTVFEYAEALQREESVPILEDVSGLLQAIPLPPREDDWTEQSRVEGRSDVLLEARELRFGEVPQMSSGVPLNGSQGWLRGGASIGCGTSFGASAHSEGISASHRSQPYEQPSREPDALRLQSRPQTVRASRFTTTDLVRVEPIHYEGIVWCVRVPTGAFVARRADKAFVTGNSGFPKSLNIGKAIQAQVTVGRSDSTATGSGDRDRDGLHWSSFPKSKKSGSTGGLPITTPEAAQWEGWGTALKPAVEIWWLVRKPLRERTVAEQVLKTGTGGINVGGSRVGYQSETDQAGAIPQGKAMGKSGALAGGVQNDNERKEFKADNTKGRWPANVVLSHSPECKKIGTRKIQGNRTDTRPEGDGGREDKENWRFRPTEATKRGYSDDSGEETIEDWECAPGCPVGALNEQSGASRSAVRIGGEGEPLDPDQNWRFKRAEGGYSDTGGASRFFHNFEPEYDVPFFYTGKITSGERKQDLEEEGLINKHPTVKTQKLMTWLVKLITPPGGTVLDPFAGSGSTLVAAVNNGFRFIGIERDPEYIKIAKGRLDKAVEREVISQEQSDLFDELMGG